MKVICKENTAKNLDPKEFPNFFREDREYPLTVGEEYLVMGIVIYSDANCPYYLIDLDGTSFWMPYGLFEISDKAFPPNWHIKVFDTKKDPDYHCVFMAGFYELCSYEKFYIDLIEREFEASFIYSRRRCEVMQWYVDRDEARKFYSNDAKIYYSIND